jgi:uncharacterized protein (TIGR02246 family)
MTVFLAVAASAQEASQSVLTAINTANADFVQHWNKQEPAAIAALFTANAVFVGPGGTYVGQAGVQKHYETLFNAEHPAGFTRDIDRVEMLSNDLALVVGRWSLSQPAEKGFWSAIYEHPSDSPLWAIRVNTLNITPH